jgi:hypothetical protein
MKKYLSRIILFLLATATLLPLLTIPVEGRYMSLEEAKNETIYSTTVTTEPLRELITYPDFQYIEQTTSNSCLKEIEHCHSYIEFLHSQEHKDACYEVTRINKIILQYQEDYARLLEEETWGEKMNEYPIATKIWRIMKEEYGWSDELCAGIMGNMMAEVAGGTLKYLSRWDSNGDSGLGLIQWIGGRRKDICNKYGCQIPSIEQQLEFMRDEMFGTNGVRKQISDAQLDAIMNGNSPEQITYDFARYFERCASYSYNRRRDYARIAYDYFVN